ncbi:MULTISPECIES: methanol/ethanol family PQQ-dependent dehydrogenase [unclassified Methylophaga]|jgi:PQQ-dependent dehydrogenase (methanol/ethanol family)|uniref:methanol/ethanol family PQQ-dependent dehydrogenase n=1 Tax=unclassified Methylophaga TaxID=2629249 RepID=UPI000C8A2FC2|nr:MULTISPECIES: methanol/ethanol family PQQ-dependent dehydrogenase [unclassified Methylophaga]MAK66651.1 PQQ-dependent dehydrogenase, methanol/ethanol family [Methylophaga sp.]MAY18403.1 PQQ-dependent dehydrogenase, methanol/ethanol family [Methylophaga sp.]|tara:strand:- start:10100 stop:11872 length:1773 start_codon:yes stop_codon:yes gene_type:complete
MTKTKLSLLMLSMTIPGYSVADELGEMQKNPDTWVMSAGDYANTRYSQLSEINLDNVQALKMAWSFSTGVLRGHEGNSLIIDDVMYVHTPFPNIVFALDLNNDGAMKWKYEPKQNYDETVPVMCCDVVNRGLSYGDGKIFLNQADTTLVALDINTGEMLWSDKRDDPRTGATNTGNANVFKDKIIVGISGGEFGVRGYVQAYNMSGKSLYKAYSTGPDDEMMVDPQNTTAMLQPIGKDSSLNSWQGEQWKIGGGTTWGWFSYDPDMNLYYYGTGNPSTWNPLQRPGDNKWTMSLFARDLDTGVAKWIYQMTPHDEWDYDGVNENILVDQKIKGKMRKMLVHFDRNGFGYTMDRATGELLVAEKFDPSVNWADNVNLKTGLPDRVAKYSPATHGEDTQTTGICPAAHGAKDQQPAAFSPKTGLFYVPTNHICMDLEPFEVEYLAGQPYVGAEVNMYAATENNMGNFIAWDAREGKIVWSNPERFSVWSGAMVTAGDVVFYGTLEGYLKALDAKTGRELWRFKTPSGIIGNVNSYKHGGKQYISILSGIGGWAGIGMTNNLENDTDGLGAVGAYKSLSNWTSLGGVLSVFSL